MFNEINIRRSGTFYAPHFGPGNMGLPMAGGMMRGLPLGCGPNFGRFNMGMSMMDCGPRVISGGVARMGGRVLLNGGAPHLMGGMRVVQGGMRVVGGGGAHLVTDTIQNLRDSGNVVDHVEGPIPDHLLEGGRPICGGMPGVKIRIKGILNMDYQLYDDF